jgi:hypothetical protein
MADLPQVGSHALINLPSWAPYFAFYASMALVAFQLLKIVLPLFSGAKAEFRITKEIFFRLTTDGEVLFCNGVLVSHKGGILQKEVKVTLEKSDAAKKVFPFEVLNFGTPVKGAGAMAEFFFYTASALSYIQENAPLRNIYYCANREYSEKIRKLFDTYNEMLVSNKKLIEVSQKQTAGGGQPLPDAKAFVDNLPSIIEKLANDIMENFQLEKGSYKLSVDIVYEQKNSPLPRFWNKSSKSSISFDVGDDVKLLMKSQLINLLQTLAWNILDGRNQPLVFPEYKPFNIRELVISKQ